MTYTGAVQYANRLKEKDNEDRYVIREGVEYFVATDSDLNTWFAGTPDRNILYVTGDWL